MKLTRPEAEEFLFREARLLDERRFEDWLQLFTPDGLYWIPMGENTDPKREPSVLYDDTDLRAKRVHQLLHQPHYAQMPPSRTVHVISNVDVEQPDQGDEATVRCALVVHELRPGDHLQLGFGAPRAIIGRAEYRLRHDGEWRIALKKVLLLDRHLPLHNMSLIV